jgi:drug/metabolite transporter (DMT)-like permease
MRDEITRRAAPAFRQSGASRGLVRANFATLLFGLAGVLGALSGLPAPIITFSRALFAGATLGVVALFTRAPLRPRSRRDLMRLITQGLLLALHWTAFFESIAVSNIAIGLLAFSCFPLFTAAFEPLLLSQRPRLVEIAAALLILPGVYLLTPHLTLTDHATQGVLWGLLAGATFALLSVINRGLTWSYSPLTISLYQDGVAAVALLPVLALTPWRAALNPRTLAILLALGVVCTALAHTLFIASLRDIRAQIASLIAALEPVWGIAFALAFLSQRPTPRILGGGALIVLASALPALAALREPTPTNSTRRPPTHTRSHSAAPE